LEKGADPEMRRYLLMSASTFVDKENAPILKDQFLQAVNDPDTPESLRVGSLRSLRYSMDPEVERSLFAATESASEKVRVAAYEQLATRPGARERLRELLERDRTASRDLGSCHLMIAEKRG
ncbi:MAG: hypothetical protein ACREQ9_15020, partial [Candidatus Binatia bacterium]